LKLHEDELGEIGRAFFELIEYQKEKVRAAEEIARGNLNLNLEGASKQDSLGIALETMVNSLNRIVGQLHEVVDRVAASSLQVAETSNSLSQRTSEQASSLQEITKSMIDIGKVTDTNAENAVQANSFATTEYEAASKGVGQMKEMMMAMDGIIHSSQEIAKIIKSIDEIAFQTNLLALNAAVEAARAGKHGKGFAVVAEEVRNLASRSAESARETAELIDGAVKKVKSGSDIAKKTSHSLDNINEGATKIVALLKEIDAASNEQARGISQVNQNLAHIDAITNQNTLHARETNAASTEFSSQASEVKKLLKYFKIKGRSYSHSVSTISPENNGHKSLNKIGETKS
ncbi:MAG: methyl-accepting chemotaxis protein, partial [Nitrospinota bacterium]